MVATPVLRAEVVQGLEHLPGLWAEVAEGAVVTTPVLYAEVVQGLEHLQFLLLLFSQLLYLRFVLSTEVLTQHS